MDTEPDVHPEWLRLASRISRRSVSRRDFLVRAAAIAGGLTFSTKIFPRQLFGAEPDLQSIGLPDRASWPSTSKIKHVVILCQENRSFDHYFGYFASLLGQGKNKAEGFVPSHLTYTNSKGARFHPYHLTRFCDEDPDHSWEGSHAKWNAGAMNGWLRAESGSERAIGYFEERDHIYHVKLAQAFTIADHYFCAQIGPTLPNRLYLWTGTSGWNYLKPATTANSLPYNNPSLTAPPPVLMWPTMPDVLEAAKLPWKCYSVADGSAPSAIGAFNPLIFFSQFLEDPPRLAKATAEISEFFTDLAAGTLPAVSWIVTEAAVCEHPPAPPDIGQLLVSRVVQELVASSAWESTALFVVYDEGGGFFDHVPPNILERVPKTGPDPYAAVGPGFRVPLTVVSPWAKPGTVFKDRLDHTSILRFIERTFSTKTHPLKLPTINSARRRLADLREAFDFRQNPETPSLPTPRELYSKADKTVLMLNLDRTLADCTTTLPTWLPQLLGV